MKLGVCYYPEQWDRSSWKQDSKAMKALGIKVVRIAEFAWGRMEPHPGEYEWEWLDDAIETLAESGLQLVLGTPTAAPPRWLLNDHPDILAIDAQARPRNFGSRRHYCFSNENYLEACRKIVTAMAQRYGQHPAVIAWQIDNEYGCHDTVLSYSDSALRNFRAWLAGRYGDIETLNARWGNVFWSMEYSDFSEIGFPVATPTLVNPIHTLDFRRFASEEVRNFNRVQCDILRTHSPGRDILHNFMGFFGEFDHHELAKDLDLASWDNYPLGLVDTVRFIPEHERLQWMRTGHPDVSAFHHDLYRGMCNKRWWVMEQQPGPVNWANANPSPLPGMVRAWTWEAFAHGAELVSYFRWRQVPYAQEQMHSGLHTPDGELDIGGIEVAQVAAEIAKLDDMENSQVAKVALVMDYTSKWMIDIQPQGSEFDYFGQVFSYYSALRRLGLDIDILPPSADLSGYSLVVVPLLNVVDEAFVQALSATNAKVVLGPRCGAKTEDFAIPGNLPPGPLVKLLPMRVRRVESLRSEITNRVRLNNGGFGKVRLWREFIEAGAEVEVSAFFEDDGPAVLHKGNFSYHAGCFDAELLRTLLEQQALSAGLKLRELRGGLRLRRRGNMQFAVNYGPDPVRLPIPSGTKLLLGNAVLAPAEIAIWRDSEPPASSTNR